MEEASPIMECPLSYSLTSERGEQLEKGEGRGRLVREGLVILPKFGELLSVPFRDITGITAKNYRVHLLLSSGERITLWDLGYDYENFLRVLNRLRNEVLLQDLLMSETLRKSDVEVEFVFTDEGGRARRGRGSVRLYETGLVVIPEQGEMFRIPYSDLVGISERGVSLTLATEAGERLVLSKMGRELDPFKRTLSEALNELQMKVSSLLRELLPGLSPVSLRAAARLMREGRAAKREELEALDPNLWRGLEGVLDTFGVGEAYRFLKGMSRQSKICIGLKRGLLGDLTGQYVWFLIPIYDIDPRKPGNAVAMEATSEEGGGKATYFFRIVSRKDYPKFKRLEDLDREADRIIGIINRCMLAINFRREPIYLPEERLEEPRYLRYKLAVQRLPSLRLLRDLFIGRVVHASPEQWRRDVMDLLTFNVKVGDDSLKWQGIKGETGS